MNTSTNAIFLKEMGITEWAYRDTVVSILSAEVTAGTASNTQEAQVRDIPEKISYGTWWFFGNKPQGDAEVLFQNIIRALGLLPGEWSWKSPSDNLNALEIPENGLPTIAFVFGAPAAQKLSGERDPLPELRETVLTLKCDLAEEIPLIASFDLAQLLTRPKDKSLLWQDLLLSKSVLQNI
jgi:DNA polymerase